MSYFRRRRLIELAALDHPWIGELFMRRRFARAPLTPPEGWDREYEAGVYDRLLRSEQRHHHRLLAMMAVGDRRSCAMLEIGCGEGAFAETVCALAGVDYLGVDFSAVAIKRARRRFADRPGALGFEVGDGRSFEPDRLYDAIVFPECIEYLGEIEPLLDRYAGYLTPGGVIGVSQWLGVRPLRLWRRLKAWGETVDEAVVMAPWGGGWLTTTVRPR